MASFFRSTPVAEIPGVEKIENIAVDDLADEILDMTYGKLKTLQGSTQEAAEDAADSTPPQDVIEDVIEDAAEDTSSEEKSGEELTGEDAELAPEEIEKAEDAAEQVSGALGSLPFSKLSLTKILKGLPDIVGQGNKATVSRRAFRKAVNDAAGTQIFEEDYIKLGNLLLEGASPASKDEEVMARWKILAGLKNEDRS